MLEQALAGPDAREDDRFHGHRTIGANARIRGRLERACVWKICAIVSAARFLARRGGACDRAAYRHQVFEIQPVVPREIERALRGAETGAIEVGVERIELALRARERAGVPQDADTLPHRVGEPLAQRLQIAWRQVERPLAA